MLSLLIGQISSYLDLSHPNGAAINLHIGVNIKDLIIINSDQHIYWKCIPHRGKYVRNYKYLMENIFLTTEINLKCAWKYAMVYLKSKLIACGKS